ncbi:retrovirus-related pol polyprotein from transposon TNT 1-94, partial [Tanacetum coccineum]
LKTPVWQIRTDNETEFVNQTLREYYEKVGISHETSVAHSPQQNGFVERHNHTLIEAALAITDWDILFQPLFDELLTPSPSVDHPAPEVIAPIAEVVAPEPAALTGSPSLKTVNQDAPYPKVPSDQSSSTDSIHTIVHPDHQISEHNSKWTKDHPLENIIGELDRPVSHKESIT